MKVATELNVQAGRIGKAALDDSNRLCGAERLDQGLACDHQDDDRSGDHREASLSNRLQFIGSVQQDFES
jgi:hypothetical protein